MIREEREKEKAKLIKERNHELNEVRNRYAGEYRAIELERSQMKNNVDSIKIPKYDSEISSRKINEYTIQIPKRVRTNTAFKSALLAGLTGVWAYEEREETKWFLDKMTLYEDGIKINKNISFGDITENSYDEKNGLYYFLIRTHADEIIFNTTNKQVLNDLNDAIGNYHLKIRNRIINERNEEIYKKERSLSNKNLNHLNSREKDTKKRQKMEEDAIYKNYTEKLHDVNRKYEKMRKEKLEELIEEDEIKEKKELEIIPEDTEKTKKINEKVNENEYQNFMTSQGMNIPAYSTPYDFDDEEDSESTRKGLKDEDNYHNPDDLDKKSNSNFLTERDNIILIPYDESIISNDIGYMINYQQKMLGYQDAAESFEKRGLVNEAIVLYEKIVEEYKYGSVFPHNRLISIYKKQNRFGDIIRICNLAIENMGHEGYLNGKILMIDPKATFFMEDVVNQFKKRKKQAQNKLIKQKEQEKKEKQSQEEKDFKVHEEEHSLNMDEEYKELKEIYEEKIKEGKQKQTDEEAKELSIDKNKDEILNETKNMHITSSDNLVLKPFKESLDIEENIKAIQKYDETVLSYNDEGKMLEKNDQIEEAIIIYEKLVNEYKFGGNFPYDRLNAIYYKQNNPKEIIRICNLAIENLGHVGYLRGKELMINPEVTSAGTKEKVKKFKDRKKREEKKLKKSEQKEKEKEKQAQDQEIIEKCANDLELAQRLEEEDKIDEAIKLYETVTKAKYPEKLPYNRLCILYRKKKNFKKELTTCNKAIRNLSNKKPKEWFKERKIKVQEKIDK